MFQKMNMELKMTKNANEKNTTLHSNVRERGCERKILSPLPLRKNFIDKELYANEQDYCSDDSVKDPNYENTSIDDSSSSENFYTKSQQRKKKYTRTKEITAMGHGSELVSSENSSVKPSASNVLKENEVPTLQHSERTIITKEIVPPKDSNRDLKTLASAKKSSSPSKSSDSSTSSSSCSDSSGSGSSSDSENENDVSKPIPQPTLIENRASNCVSTPVNSTLMNPDCGFGNPSNENENIAPVEDIPAIELLPSNIQDPYVITQDVATQDDDAPKTVRKRKLDPANWTSKKAKLLRNSGKSYISKAHKLVTEKSLKPPCGDKCKLKCTESITNLQRKEIFDSYWAIGDVERQREFILRHLSTVTPRYGYKVHDSNRGNNNAFYLTVNDKRIRVCKTYFKATLDITDRLIRTVVQKHRKFGTLEEDQRGKHKNHQTIDPAIKDSVRQHLDSIPKIESHYCRADTHRVFIDGGKTIADLHRDYVNDCKSKGLPSANYIMYYHIFNKEYNISFFQPKKDQCEDCTSFANASEEDKVHLREYYDQHLKEKALARQEKDDDKKYSPDNCIVSVYDLQAAMPCPRGDVSNFYYISKLNVYNFTLCNLKNKDVTCFVWHEGEAKRGAIEIGTCVLKYLESFKETAENLDSKLDFVFYSDNCCGQQKNQYIIGLYIYAVHHLAFVNSITHKFLIKGHTQNEGDSVHSLIERNIQKSLKSGPIFTPDQYTHIIRNSKKTGKAYQVNELTHDDFIDIKSLAAAIGKNFSKNTEKKVVKMTDIKILKVELDGAEDYSFQYKTSYEDNQFKKIVVDNIGKTRNSNNNSIKLKKIYKSKIALCEKKKKGLLTLIKKNVIPKFYTSFFENL